MAEGAVVLRQLIEGEDFDTPKRLLNVKLEMACSVPAGMPYSIATQVGHMQCWQRRWLDGIEGKPVHGYPTKAEDFPTVAPDDWAALREKFLADLGSALLHAEGDPSPEVWARLSKIALHNAYHFGQIKLLKRILKGQV